MKRDQVKVGLRVKTNKKLGNTKGFLISRKNLDVRKPNKNGIVVGWVPGHGGDVWWVQHNDGTVGAYDFDEFSAK